MERYFPANCEITEYPEAKLVVGRYSDSGRPIAIGYSGKAKKAAFHFRFPSEEAREKWLDEEVQGRTRREKEKEEARQKQREAQKTVGTLVKPGDIFCSSWGWEQTNVNFYQVIKVSGQFAEFREIASAVVEQTGWCSDTRTAAPDKIIGEPFRRKLKALGDGKVGVDISSYEWASLWDGKPHYCTYYA